MEGKLHGNLNEGRLKGEDVSTISMNETKEGSTYSTSYLEARRVYLSAFTLAIIMGFFNPARTGAAASNCHSNIIFLILFDSEN